MDWKVIIGLIFIKDPSRITMWILLNFHHLVPFNQVGDGLEIIHDANEVDDDTLEDNEIDRDVIFNHIFKMSTNCQRVRLSDKDKENVDEVLNDVNENGTADDQERLVLNGVLGQMVSNHGNDSD